jgi:tetratricopeptide (TPR) repeat protein
MTRRISAAGSCVLLALIFFFVSRVGAQQPDDRVQRKPGQDWAGRRIVMLTGFGDYLAVGKNGKAELVKSDGLSVNIVAEAQRVDGDRIWIRANGAGKQAVGWVPAGGAILLEDAVPYFAAVIDRNPRDWDAYLRRAEAEQALNKRQAAIQDYTRAIDLDPEEAFLFLRRGRSFRTSKACSQATADFESAAHLRPQWAEPYNMEAGVYSDCPDSTFRNQGKAIELIQHAISLDHMHPAYLTVLALAYSRSGRLEEAFRTQRQAIDSPDFPVGYRDEAMRQLHEYEDALGARKR